MSGSAGTRAPGAGRRSDGTSRSRAIRSGSRSSTWRRCEPSRACGSRPGAASLAPSPGPGNRILAVVEAPSGAVVTTVDPLAGRVVRTTRLSRPFGYQFDRLPDGLVFLLGDRNRSGPAQVAVVDAQGETRVATVRQAAVGSAGLAVDPVGRRAYLVDGERVFGVDLRTLDSSDSGPLRTLAKAPLRSIRSARWLGNGLLAVSGLDRDATGSTPARPPARRRTRQDDTHDRSPGDQLHAGGSGPARRDRAQPPGPERDRVRLRWPAALSASTSRARPG